MDVRAELTKPVTCPFCSLAISPPKETSSGRKVEMPFGVCNCGAVYVADITGHNIGTAKVDALLLACNMDWDLAWDLLPDDDYVEDRVEHYDPVHHLVIPGGVFEGRRISGVLYFIRLHEDVQEVTRPGVEKLAAEAIPYSQESAGLMTETLSPRPFSKSDFEKYMSENQPDQIVAMALQDDTKTIAALQRKLYAVDDLPRFRAAEILGRVAAELSNIKPKIVSNLLHRLIYSCSDSAASNWGAMEAIGEIVSRKPTLFGGYINQVLPYLNDRDYTESVLHAIVKLSRNRPDYVKRAKIFVVSLLDDPKPVIRGLAVCALGNMKAKEFKDEVAGLQTDEGDFSQYEDGVIKTKSVARLATEALAKINLPT
ncbi:MAG: PBS lyase [Deltaproteobacteria bacterium]|nr:PBS lyase [Deltaproteobacteria bacterium]